MTWAKVGIRCVCIRADLFDPFTGEASDYLVKDAIYKITSVNEFTRCGATLMLGLWGMPMDVTFNVNAFRPLVSGHQTEEADVALFKPALSPDPILIADLYECDMGEIEAALNRTDFP